MAYKQQVNNRRTYLRGLEPGLRNSMPGVFDTGYEEPTYLSFKLHLGSLINAGSSITGLNEMPAPQNKVGLITNYDLMPTPFFQLKSPLSYRQENSHLQPGSSKQLGNQEFVYSAYDYLFNSNQAYRAELLLEFIQGWSELQFQNQYFFTKVSGIGGINAIDAKDGQRLKNKKISITFRDSVDQRVRYLLSLYKRIVWDDTYQRWALPDMMRYFRLYVFISEIRTFHSAVNPNARHSEYEDGPKILGRSETSNSGRRKSFFDNIQDEWNKVKNTAATTVKNEFNKATSALISQIPETGIPIVDNFIDEKTGRGSISDVTRGGKVTDYNLDDIMAAASFVYRTVNDISPVTVYEFDMCDIDLASINKIFKDSYTNTNPEESTEYTFDVNVRNVRVIEHYNILNELGRWPRSSEFSFAPAGPVALSYDSDLSSYLDDDLVNRINRNLQPQGVNISSSVINTYSTLLQDSSYFTDDMFMGEHEKFHIPGVSYHKSDLTTGIDPRKQGGQIANNSLLAKLTGSAIKSAINLGANVGRKVVNKALNTKIGSTELSINDIFGVFKSGDFMGTAHAIGKAANGILDPAGNAIGLRGADGDVIMRGALARIASVRPTDELEFRNTLIARELLSPNKKGIYDDLMGPNVNKDFIDFQLDEIYRDQFEKYKLALEGNRDQWSLNNKLIDNSIYDAKFELARLIVTAEKPIKLADLGFSSTEPLKQLDELNLLGEDKKKILLLGLSQECFKLEELSPIDLRLIKPEDLQLIGLPQSAIKTLLELQGLPQNATKDSITLENIPQNANKNQLDLNGIPQGTEKNELELTGVPQDANKSSFDLINIDQTVTKEDHRLMGLPQDANKSKYDPTSIEQEALKNNLDLYTDLNKPTKSDIVNYIDLVEPKKNEVDPELGDFYSIDKTKQSINDLDFVGSNKNDTNLLQNIDQRSEKSDFRPEVQLNTVSKNSDALERSSIYRKNGISDLEMFNDKDLKDSLLNTEKMYSAEKNTRSQFSGPFYSTEPNKDFLNDMRVEVHPDNPAKSKLVRKHKTIKDEPTNTSGPGEHTLSELKKNIYNKRD